MQVDPIKGNVAFGACQSGWSFTLLSFAQLYCDVYGAAMDPKQFARRLWGDIYFQPTTRKFKRSQPDKTSERTFVQYILTPLYKIYSQVCKLMRPLCKTATSCLCQWSLDAALPFSCHCLLAAAWPACLTTLTWWLALAWLVSLYKCKIFHVVS